MSDIRIALIAEGPTDRIVIEAALRAILPCTFLLTVLQPEATRPEMGSGWGGVLKWCHAANLRHQGSLDNEPTLAGFDLLILQIDADVAEKQYLDCGQQIADMARQFTWQVLPCGMPCPPPENTCTQLQNAITSWLGNATPGRKTVLCIPSKSVGTWLAAAVLPPDHPLMADAECNIGLENQLAVLPLAQRIKKSPRDFRRHEQKITDNWAQVTRVCSQALHFQQTIQRQAVILACQQA